MFMRIIGMVLILNQESDDFGVMEKYHPSSMIPNSILGKAQNE